MKRPIADSGDDEAGESNNDELDDLVEDDAADGSRGRVRCVWTAELHDKFEAAIQAIGMEKAKPMGILMHMGVTGITKANIKSHLQKYRVRTVDLFMRPGRPGRHARPRRPFCPDLNAI
ncbi:hypothetical protein Ctob_007445 [Chrysochromulina tobinii]|uniref:HTH myb-type domain-containing protein n=1 Tax=Chrysochromulina tobinii TaxID=1460289 RepID=A0A0M0JX61_9EUKA|nr:hypothetical protein Ctob_007445 [Chrysochromulina tobinii]|eukprot:KOO31246.1 hypothetical protein Ctob_007445 [Chrysochromulina sp. CCMP291]